MSNVDKINVNGTEYGIEGAAGDSKDDTTTFTSSDVADGNATTWTSVNVLTSGEKHSSIFAKVSQMFKNVRYLYKLLGTTDFSGLGTDISGALNNLEDIIVKGVETSSTASQAYAKDEYMVYNKKLYKVKAAIASGATITVGTNIESANTNVGNELTSLKSSLNDLDNNKQDVITWKSASLTAGTLAVPAGTWTGATDTVTLAVGTYLAIASCAKSVQYLRIAKHNNVDEIYLNKPYGNVMFGTFDVSTQDTLRLWVYTNTALTIAVDEIKMQFIKIA